MAAFETLLSMSTTVDQLLVLCKFVFALDLNDRSMSETFANLIRFAQRVESVEMLCLISCIFGDISINVRFLLINSLLYWYSRVIRKMNQNRGSNLLPGYEHQTMMSLKNFASNLSYLLCRLFAIESWLSQLIWKTCRGKTLLRSSDAFNRDFFLAFFLWHNTIFSFVTLTRHLY